MVYSTYPIILGTISSASDMALFLTQNFISSLASVIIFYDLPFFSGMTNSNYTELNQLYDKYRDQGLRLMFVWKRTRDFIFQHCLWVCIAFLCLRVINNSLLITLLQVDFLHYRPGNTSISLQSVWWGRTWKQWSDIRFCLRSLQVRIPHLWQGGITKIISLITK